MVWFLGGTAVLCLLYYIIIVIYSGVSTSFALIWPCLAIFLGLLAAGWWFGSQHEGRIPVWIGVSVGTVCAAGFLILVITEVLIGWSAITATGQPADYVIVLGAQVHADKPSVVLKYRLDEAILYLNENPETVCIVAGGQGKNEPYSEAYGMAQYLMQNGIDKERILLEDQSKTTEENLRFSRKFLPEGAEVGIITNDFHMFRALQIAQKQGLSDACGIAADSTKFYLPNNMLREYFAEIKFLIRSVK